MDGRAKRALDAYKLAHAKEEAYDAAYRGLAHSSGVLKKAEERLEEARDARTRAAAKVHEAAAVFVDAERRAEVAYRAAEGAISEPAPTELSAANRGSIGRQAAKATSLLQWIKLLS
ncbi:hypothetical protein [Candidatus Palauibacter sp.]|uniref:hypothetical protein n=1 Tax=Candidatus Palauibacter sp. TaxID=3101350 RepID=UPI003AF31335